VPRLTHSHQACCPPTRAASFVLSSAASRRRSFGNTLWHSRSQVRVPTFGSTCNAAVCCRYSLVRGTVIAFCMTLFQVFDIPVFWPILVLYVAIPFNPICTLYFSCFFFRFSSSSVPPPPRLTPATVTSSFYCSSPCADRFSTCEPYPHFFFLSWLLPRSSFTSFSSPRGLSSFVTLAALLQD
jgi:hypothetical protein